jgi:hypothetical protein
MRGLLEETMDRDAFDTDGPAWTAFAFILYLVLCVLAWVW